MSRISRQQVNIQQSRTASRDAGTRKAGTTSDSSKPAFEQSMQKASPNQTPSPQNANRKQVNTRGSTQQQPGKPAGTGTSTTSQSAARQQTTSNTRLGSENLTREQPADSFPAVASSVLDMFRGEKTETPERDTRDTFDSGIPDRDLDSAMDMLIEQLQAYQPASFEDNDSPRSFTLLAGSEHEFELLLTWQTDGQVTLKLGDDPERSRQSHKQLLEQLRRQFEQSDSPKVNGFDVIVDGDGRFQ